MLTSAIPNVVLQLDYALLLVEYTLLELLKVICSGLNIAINRVDLRLLFFCSPFVVSHFNLLLSVSFAQTTNSVSNYKPYE